MSRRDNHEGRCATCKMHLAFCICSITPRLETRTRLLLVIHRDEERKPTNTGQLAARCLVNSTVVVTGDLARPLPLPLIQDHERGVVLFPSDDAVPLASLVVDKPLVLVVPDGTWRQAQKSAVRTPGLAELTRVSLPDDGCVTRYQLRTERRPGGLATLEAIARAYRILEGDCVAQQMLAVFEAMVTRTLATRGVAPAPSRQ